MSGDSRSWHQVPGPWTAWLQGSRILRDMSPLLQRDAGAPLVLATARTAATTVLFGMDLSPITSPSILNQVCTLRIIPNFAGEKTDLA